MQLKAEKEKLRWEQLSVAPGPSTEPPSLQSTSSSNAGAQQVERLVFGGAVGGSAGVTRTRTGVSLTDADLPVNRIEQILLESVLLSAIQNLERLRRCLLLVAFCYCSKIHYNGCRPSKYA